MFGRKIYSGMFFVLCKAGIGYCSASNGAGASETPMQSREEGSHNADIQAVETSSEPGEAGRGPSSKFEEEAADAAFWASVNAGFVEKEGETIAPQNPSMHRTTADREEDLTGEFSHMAQEGSANLSSGESGHTGAASSLSQSTKEAGLSPEMVKEIKACVKESIQELSSVAGIVSPVEQAWGPAEVLSLVRMHVREELGTVVGHVSTQSADIAFVRVTENLLPIIRGYVSRLLQGEMRSMMERTVKEIISEARRIEGEEEAHSLESISTQDEAIRTEAKAENGSQFHFLGVLYDGLSASIVELDVLNLNKAVSFECKDIDKESLCIYMNDAICERSTKVQEVFEQLICKSDGLIMDIEGAFIKEMSLLLGGPSLIFKEFASNLRSVIIVIDATVEGRYDDPQAIGAIKDAICGHREDCLININVLNANCCGGECRNQEVEKLFRFMTEDLIQVIDRIFAKMTAYLEECLKELSIMAKDYGHYQSLDSEMANDIINQILEAPEASVSQLKKRLLHSQSEHKAVLNRLFGEYGYLVNEGERVLKVGGTMLDFLNLLDQASATSNRPSKEELIRMKDGLLKEIDDILASFSPLTEVDGILQGNK